MYSSSSSSSSRRLRKRGAAVRRGFDPKKICLGAPVYSMLDGWWVHAGPIHWLRLSLQQRPLDVSLFRDRQLSSINSNETERVCVRKL